MSAANAIRPVQPGAGHNGGPSLDDVATTCPVSEMRKRYESVQAMRFMARERWGDLDVGPFESIEALSAFGRRVRDAVGPRRETA